MEGYHVTRIVHVAAILTWRWRLWQPRMDSMYRWIQECEYSVSVSV